MSQRDYATGNTQRSLMGLKSRRPLLIKQVLGVFVSQWVIQNQEFYEFSGDRFGFGTSARITF
jgi:hypothetical protein